MTVLLSPYLKNYRKSPHRRQTSLGGQNRDPRRRIRRGTEQQRASGGQSAKGAIVRGTADNGAGQRKICCTKTRVQQAAVGTPK